MPSTEQLFHVDNLSLIMMGLVGFVSLSIASFSFRYLKGDRKQLSFYLNLVFLIFSVFLMVSADHILLFFVTWTTSNLFLTRLMLHKSEWLAARHSSLLALKNFSIGLVFIGCALGSLYYNTGQTSIQLILGEPIEYHWRIIISLLFILGAISQSALWPFHRWLTSSLNAPTPVSAIMHAGLVNGGGFLLVRFAPVFFDQTFLLNLIFVIGTISALLGTLWKLMQSDIKRMLACSTMSQMGFMIVQCGLGLFPAAVAHLCWHGLFKAYLFLGSGSAAQEKRIELSYPPGLNQILLALICGGLGAYAFSITSNKSIFAGDTTLFMILLAMIAGTQLALPILRSHLLIKLPAALLTNLIIGAVYGFNIHLIEALLAPLGISKAIPINAWHVTALFLLFISWLLILLGSRQKLKYPDWLLKIYVRMLNASQPHPKTVTTHRNHYRY